MQTKTDQRATRPTRSSLSGPAIPAAARLRPGHAERAGRGMQRDVAAPGDAVQMQAPTGVSMDYQLGFTSGPSG
jgi:hypothetical protein